MNKGKQELLITLAPFIAVIVVLALVYLIYGFVVADFAWIAHTFEWTGAERGGMVMSIFAISVMSCWLAIMVFWI